MTIHLDCDIYTYVAVHMRSETLFRFLCDDTINKIRDTYYRSVDVPLRVCYHPQTGHACAIRLRSHERMHHYEALSMNRDRCFFARLPTELRQMVWMYVKACYRAHCFVCYHAEIDGYSADSRDTNNCPYLNSQVYCQYPPPIHGKYCRSIVTLRW